MRSWRCPRQSSNCARRASPPLADAFKPAARCGGPPLCLALFYRRWLRQSFGYEHHRAGVSFPTGVWSRQKHRQAGIFGLHPRNQPGMRQVKVIRLFIDRRGKPRPSLRGDLARARHPSSQAVHPVCHRRRWTWVGLPVTDWMGNSHAGLWAPPPACPPAPARPAPNRSSGKCSSSVRVTAPGVVASSGRSCVTSLGSDACSAATSGEVSLRTLGGAAGA